MAGIDLFDLALEHLVQWIRDGRPGNGPRPILIEADDWDRIRMETLNDPRVWGCRPITVSLLNNLEVYEMKLHGVRIVKKDG